MRSASLLLLMALGGGIFCPRLGRPAECRLPSGCRGPDSEHHYNAFQGNSVAAAPTVVTTPPAVVYSLPPPVVYPPPAVEYWTWVPGHWWDRIRNGRYWTRIWVEGYWR